MKNRIVNKILRIILLTLVGAAVIGTFYFLWKKAQPVVTVYEIVTPQRDTVETKTVATGNVEPRYEVEIKPQISGIIAEIKKEAGQMVKAGEIIATIKVIPEMVQLNSAESRVNVAEISLAQVRETYKRDERLFEQGVISREDFDLSKANYLKAVDKGLLKIMSKMGIATIRSYRGSRLFDAIGIDSGVAERYFGNTSSAVGGIGLDEIASEYLAVHDAARSGQVQDKGEYSYRKDGERHSWTPDAVKALRSAAVNASRPDYDRFADMEDGGRFFLRHLLDVRKGDPIPIDEVESAESIMKRFEVGAISFGAISKEAHETLAEAMNSIGSRSNTGEGGEDPARFVPGPDGRNLRSAIKQVASGRFGVTAEYLVNADELQIKVAQGAKPGEGGQLMGFKVDRVIAATSEGQDKRQAGLGVGSRHRCRGCGKGRGRHHTGLGRGWRHRCQSAVVDKIRRIPLGDRPRGGPADAEAQRPALPCAPAGRRSAQDRQGRHRGRPPGCRGLRVRHGPHGGHGLHHVQEVPDEHMPCGYRDTGSGAQGKVRFQARAHRQLLEVHGRGRPQDPLGDGLQEP